MYIIWCHFLWLLSVLWWLCRMSCYWVFRPQWSCCSNHSQLAEFVHWAHTGWLQSCSMVALQTDAAPEVLWSVRVYGPSILHTWRWTPSTQCSFVVITLSSSPNTSVNANVCVMYHLHHLPPVFVVLLPHPQVVACAVLPWLCGDWLGGH